MHLLNDDATFMSFENFTAKFGPVTDKKNFKKLPKPFLKIF